MWKVNGHQPETRDIENRDPPVLLRLLSERASVLLSVGYLNSFV